MPPLSALRDSIDSVDEQLLGMLARRFALTAEVGSIKKQFGLPAVDSTREAAQMERFAELSAQHGLDPAFARRVMRLIIDEVVARHRQL